MELQPTREALQLAKDLRDIADRLEIMAKHLVKPNIYPSSADTMGQLSARLSRYSIDWEICKLYSKIERRLRMADTRESESLS